MSRRRLAGLVPLLAFAGMMCTIPGCASTDGAAPGSLDAALEALITPHAGPDTPGLVIGVVRDGRLEAVRSAGLADLEHRIAAGPETRFHVASVSKQFTAYGVLILAERGALSLDDPVRAHLPNLPPAYDPVTVRHLLHHTAGVRQALRLMAIAGRRGDRLLTQDAAMSLLRAQRQLDFAPGTEYSYSNGGWVLLAEVIAASTGEPFPDWMVDHVFRPLGMERTVIPSTYGQLVLDRARSYSPTDTGFRRDSGDFWAMHGGTGVHTTVRDLARWVAHLLDPPPDAAARVALMTRRGTLTDGTTVSYGMGLEVDEHRGETLIWHGGEGDGMRAMLTMQPVSGTGVIVLENAPIVREYDTAITVLDLVRDGGDASDARAAAPALAVNASRPVAPVDPDLRERLVGRWLLGPDDEPTLDRIAIEADGPGLAIVPPSRERLPLVQEGPDRLRVGQSPIWIELDAADGFTLHLPDESVPARRWNFDAAAADPDRLATFVGTYHSAEIDLTIAVTLDGTALALLHPVHGPIALAPIGEDEFEADRSTFRWVRFTRDEAGDVADLRVTIANRRVRGLRFERVASARRPIGSGAVGAPEDPR